MSAWIVSRKHIDVIVRAMKTHHVGTEYTDTELGRLLWRENLLSVAYRYPEDKDGQRPGPNDFRDNDVETYTYTEPHETYSKAAVKKTVDCYEYQSSEHRGWDSSIAHNLCFDLLEISVPSTKKHTTMLSGVSNEMQHG